MFIVTSSVPWMENFSTVSDKFFIGVTMTLLGVSIVVIVLALISLFVSSLSRLINGGRAESVKSGKQPMSAVSAPPRAVAVKAEPEPAATLCADSSDDPADHQVLIAVLAAAVSAFSADSTPRSSAGFIIRRVRRV